MVWCGMVWYDMAWCSVVWYDVVCVVVSCDVVRCSASGTKLKIISEAKLYSFRSSRRTSWAAHLA